MYIRQETADTFFDIISLTKKLILILGLRPWTSNEQQRVVQRTVLGGVLIARVGGRVTLKVAGPKSQEEKCTSHRYDTVWLEKKNNHEENRKGKKLENWNFLMFL